MRLTVDGLRAGYGSATIIDDLRLTVDEGEVFVLLGRNGMGKTTLVKALLGLLPGTRGTVAVAGHDVSAWRTHRIVRLGVGYAPQEENLFAGLTVGENLEFGAAKAQQVGARRSQVLDHFPVLGRRLRQHAGTLSGGEQKMLVLARTLIMNPRLLIVDEISDGLQPAMVKTVEALLKEIRASDGMTVVMVEQNLELALNLGDRVGVLKRGELVYETPAGRAGAHDELLTELHP